MASKEEQKEQREKTSQSLITAALQISAEEGYGSLTLRSVARQVGIAPTSFYRNFRDIDELGLAMVENGKIVMHECLTILKQKINLPKLEKNPSSDILMNSIKCLSIPFIETFMEYFKKHSNLLRLFFQEKTGSSKVLRKAITQELDKLTTDLSQYLKQLAQKSGYKFTNIRLVAETMIIIGYSRGLEMIINPEINQREINEIAIQQLNFFLLGSFMQETLNNGEKI
ncbi:MAG: TetR family transcriptional regulator [Desulfobacterales bacterium]|nr:TetR family transcriptional regulator [Desulfobacterales bacterium]MBF0397673.1 TetR family transcriptional regulator [Desulfobacterales bacterium]